MAGSGSTVIGEAVEAVLSTTNVKGINDSRVLENRGSVVYSGNNLFFGFGGGGTGKVVNAVGATFEVQGEADFSRSSGGAYAIENAGLLRKTGGGTTLFESGAVALANSGTVQVESGVLQVSGGGASTDALEVSPGAQLLVSAGTFTVAAGSAFEADGASLRVNGNGTVVLERAVSPALEVVLESGVLSAEVAQSVASFTMSGGTLQGAGDLLATGALAWSGGVMAGSGRTIVGLGVEVLISGATTKAVNSSRVFENRGSLVYSGNGLVFGFGGAGSGKVVNAAGATFEVQGEADFNRSSGGAYAIENAGLLRKTGGGTTLFESGAVALANSGTLQVEGGVLQLAAGGTNSGAIELAAGTEVQVTGGTYRQASAATSTGEGTFVLASSGVLDPVEDCRFERLRFDAGTVTGAATVSVADSFGWASGTMAGAGRTLLEETCASTVTTASIKAVNNSRVFENRGSLVYSGNGLVFGFGAAGSGKVVNAAGATFEVQGEADFTRSSGGAYALENAGLLRKTEAGITLFESGAVALANTGTVQVEEGTLQLAGGFAQTDPGAELVLSGDSTLSSTSTLTVADGRVAGRGTVQAALNVSGVLRPEVAPGLTVNGNLTLNPSSRTELTLAGADGVAGHRSLSVSGTATLAGALSVALEHPFDEPVGQVLQVIGYASRSGDFVSFEGLSQSGYVLVPSPAALAYELSVAQEGDVEEPDIDELAAAARAPGDDLDGDGLNDLLELAFGSDPDDPGSVARPTVTLVRDGDGRWQIALAFTRRPDTWSLRVVAEHATRLGGWVEVPTAGVTEQITAPSEGAPLERVRWLIDPSALGPGGAAPSGFVRLRVSWADGNEPVAAGGGDPSGQPVTTEP
jgi:hypothetical protein